MTESSALATLTALAQALSRPAELAASLEAALGTVADLLGLETGWVWLLDEDSDEPRLAASRALPAELRGHPAAMRGDCYCLRTFRAGDLEGAANVNVVRCSRLAQVVEETADDEATLALRCHASVPLAVGDRRLGMLNVASDDWRVLSEDELRVLTTAGALVSLAIERTRLEAESARAVAAEERNRLAREIHDTLAQSLAGLTLQLELAESLSEGADARLAAAVTRSLGLARDTLAEARRSVLELRALPLEGRSLPEALASLVERAASSASGSPDITFDVAGLDADAYGLPAAAAVGLYRIAQQALANVMLHADARRVAIELGRAPDHVRLVVRDDGAGFDAGDVPPARFGLTGMRERARLLGGTLDVRSAPGQGTTVAVVVPLLPRETEP